MTARLILLPVCPPALEEEGRLASPGKRFLSPSVRQEPFPVLCSPFFEFYIQ